MLAVRLRGRSPLCLGARLEVIGLQLLQDESCSPQQPHSAAFQHWAHTAVSPGPCSPPPVEQPTPLGAALSICWSYGQRSFASRAFHTSPSSLQQAESPQQQQLGDSHSEAATAAASAAAAAAAATGRGSVPSLPPSWVDHLPKAWVPYAHLMRLDKPIGTWLLAWPCFWSIALAAPPGSLPDLRMLALFGTGAVLLRGAGCTVNDLWDRDLDKQVERTRGRPLAAGLISPPQAIAFLGAQLLAGLGILLQLNWYSQVLGASSLALVATYPLMKRITGWPQAYLGLTYNWGAMLGYAAVHGQCDWAVVAPLYLAGVSWTLVYDTIYAHQDKEDDVKAGIRSTALTFGQRNKHYMAAFWAANLGLLGLAGYNAGCGLPYGVGLAAASSHLAWQLATVDLDSRPDCWAKFASNTWMGALLFVGIVADRLLA